MASSSSSSVTQLESWRTLQDHYDTVASKLQMRELFLHDGSRFDKFSRTFAGELLFDFSKNIVTERTLELLLQLAHEAKLQDAIQAMFSGAKINTTENRAVLHVALRNRSGSPIIVDGVDVMPEVQRVLEHMRQASDSIRSGEWKGFTGKRITDVVNIGIGGMSRSYALHARTTAPLTLSFSFSFSFSLSPSL